MTFTRTASGVANYNKFFGSDIVVFSEGKTDSNQIDSLLPDQIFYIQLFKAINPAWKVKVKCVGNKDAALGYLEIAKKLVHKNIFVAIDKDSFGIISSYLPAPKVIVTYGYSWENDLYSKQLALDVLSDITRENQGAAGCFSNIFEKTLRRLKLLSSLDLSSQVDGKALLPKSSKTGGISLKKSNGCLISSAEISRLINKYRSTVTDCSVIRNIRSTAYREKPQKVIQGHIWESVVRQLVSVVAESHVGIAQLPSALFSNLMLTKFSNNPAIYLGEDALQTYRQQILSNIF